MADTVTTQVIVNNARNYVAKFTDLSDATGETNVVKIAASATFTPHAKLWYIHYDVRNMGVNIQWGGTPNITMLFLSDTSGGELCFEKFGGIWNNATTPTGAVLFSTIGAAANSTYSVTMHFKLGV
jgi:hypothetical protein